MTSAFPRTNCPAVYGPVKSRRHGCSLGINLGLPSTKVCTWGCVYCQCGMGQRRELESGDQAVGKDDILDQVRRTLLTCGPLDSVTIAGNSEPTKHPEFLAIVNGLLELRKELSATWTLNCLSNGSELDQADVRRACDLLDETWIKLDCATDEMFRRLNRPLLRIGGVVRHIERIAALRRVFIQTLVWDCPDAPPLSNWNERNRRSLREVFQKLKPRKIHLTTVARYPAVSQIRAVQKPELEEYAGLLKQDGLNVETFPA